MLSRFSLFSLVILLVIILNAGGSAAAQSAVEWSEPFNVSRSVTSSSHPAVVTDDYGWVHVFWSEDMDGPEMEAEDLITPGDTILYRRWDGESWGEPLDILALAGDSLADFLAATIDDDNRIHLVWTGVTNLYYSSAPAGEAHRFDAWSAPQVVSHDSARTRYEIDVAADSAGNVHVAYATRGEQTAVFHAALQPEGGWTSPVKISNDLRPVEGGFKDVRLIVDARDRLHAAWSTTNDSGFSQAVYYGRAENPFIGWEPPVTLSDAVGETGFNGWPNLLAHGEDDLLLIYVGEEGEGRIEQTSSDGGRTWNSATLVLPDMVGVNGFLIPLVDGSGQLHLMINMRPFETQQTGIYYAPRAGQGWGTVASVAVDAPYGPTAHYTDAVVRRGNEIHAVWTQARGGEIWYARGDIGGVEAAAVQPVPTPAPPTDAAGSIERVSVAAGPEAETSAAGSPLPEELTAPPVEVVSIWRQIGLILLPVVLLLGGMLLWQLRKR